jgi:AcrR family transcriptional regulator
MARPRSERAHERVLEAATTLFGERGLDATSMDAIAEASGVSKATIYNHWPDKDALCLEVMTRVYGVDRPPAAGSASTDVRAALVELIAQQPFGGGADRSPIVLADPATIQQAMRMRMHLMAYAARNPAFGQAWRARVFDPPRLRLAELLERAIAEGQLPPTLDRELAVALLLGPMMYRHVLTLARAEAPRNLAEQVVGAFWRAHAIAPPASPELEATR